MRLVILDGRKDDKGSVRIPSRTSSALLIRLSPTFTQWFLHSLFLLNLVPCSITLLYTQCNATRSHKRIVLLKWGVAPISFLLLVSVASPLLPFSSPDLFSNHHDMSYTLDLVVSPLSSLSCPSTGRSQSYGRPLFLSPRSFYPSHAHLCSVDLLANETCHSLYPS